MSGTEFDGFNDVINGSAGIFDGGQASIAGSEGGLQNFDRPSTTAMPQGVAVGMLCRGCGRPAQLVIEYPELVAIKYNVAPHVAYRGMQPLPMQEVVEWRYSTAQQAWWPVRPCRFCQTPVAPLFSPEEAEAHLAKARRQNWTNPAAEKMLSEAAYRTVLAMQQQAAQGYAR